MLHPSARPRWAQRMCDLLARPHGRLICREHPTGKLAESGGPPYFAPFWCYQLHLAHPGNKRVIDYGRKVLDVSGETVPSSRPGLTMLARFELQAFNGSDNSANGNDWVSIWGFALGQGRASDLLPSTSQNTGNRVRKKIKIRVKKKEDVCHGTNGNTATIAINRSSDCIGGVNDGRARDELPSAKAWLARRTATTTRYQ